MFWHAVSPHDSLVTSVPFSLFFTCLFFFLFSEEQRGRPALTLGEELRLKKVGEGLDVVYRLFLTCIYRDFSLAYISLSSSKQADEAFCVYNFISQTNQIYT